MQQSRIADCAVYSLAVKNNAPPISGHLGTLSVGQQFGDISGHHALPVGFGDGWGHNCPTPGSLRRLVDTCEYAATHREITTTISGHLWTLEDIWGHFRTSCLSASFEDI